MADIGDLLNEMRSDGTLYRIATDPRAQFGTRTRDLKGASILPERLVGQNQYKEEQIRFRTVIANGSTRYSPAQKKGGALVGSFNVILGEADIATEFTSRDYDTVLNLINGLSGPLVNQNAGIQATAMMVNFLETTVRDALVDLTEVWRWQAMVSKVVALRGDNGLSEDIAYPNYPDLTADAGGDWSNDTYDPYEDIDARVLAMTQRGQNAARIFIGRQAFTKFAGNLKVRARVGKAIIGPGGTLQGTVGRATLNEINGQNESDGLPPFELYDEQYRTEVGADYFLQRDAMVIVAATGRNENIDLGDGQYETLDDTIGYAAIGRPAGENAPGTALRMWPKDDKPPRVECQGWRTMLPVITEPEGLAVITGIK